MQGPHRSARYIDSIVNETQEYGIITVGKNPMATSMIAMAELSQEALEKSVKDTQSSFRIFPSQTRQSHILVNPYSSANLIKVVLDESKTTKLFDATEIPNGSTLTITTDKEIKIS